MPTKIPDDVIAVLEAATVQDRTLVLTGQLDRKLYVQVDKVLQALGGRWNRSAKAHVFPEPAADVVDAVVLTGEYVDFKREFDAFYTPADVASRVIELAEIKPYQRVLEPSAGEGALALAAADAADGVLVHAYEIRCGISDWWEDAAGAVLMRPPMDFLTVEADGSFDRVVMNPPFSKQQDMAHVTHAFGFLKPGGRLVAVMSPSWQYRTSKAALAFRELYETYDGTVEELPDGSFQASGTGVRSVIVALEKPALDD